MAVWDKNKVDSSDINGGNQFTTDDDLSVAELNAIVNNSFYASEVAKKVDEELKKVVAEKGTVVYEGTTPLASLIFKSDPQSQIDKINNSIQVQVDNVKNNVSNPNLLINGDFRINQRGQTSYNTSGYTFDRWRLENNYGTISKTGNTVTLKSTSANTVYLVQRLEDSASLVGKTVTLSIGYGNYVQSATGVLVAEAGDSLVMSFGAGRARIYYYENTQVFGITLEVNIENQISFDWVKLEIGSIATPLSPRPYVEELSMCQRYFYRYKIDLPFGILGNVLSYETATRYYCYMGLPTEMRVKPTITKSGNLRVVKQTGTDIVTEINGYDNVSTQQICVGITTSTGASWSVGGLQANNDGTAHIDFDAEIY